MGGPAPQNIFDNEVEKLNLVPKLGNYKNYLRFSPKMLMTKIFDGVSILGKNGKIKSIFQIYEFIKQELHHNDWYQFGITLVYTFN